MHSFDFVSNKKQYIQTSGTSLFATITILSIVIKSLIDAYLAFASSRYSPVFETIVISISRIACIISPIYVFTNNKKITRGNFVLLILPFYYILCLILNTKGGYNLEWITTFICACSFLLFSDKDKARTFYVFYKVVQIGNFFSIIMLICFLLGINIGIEQVPYYLYYDSFSGSSSTYLRWGIFAIYNKGLTLRLCSFFNEAGGLGTICGILYVACNRYISKRERVLLLITTVLTFSLAGFFIIFLYYILLMIRRMNFKHFLIIITVLLLYFVVLPQINFGNEQINNFVQRLRITSSGLQGDNRVSENLIFEFKDFLKSDNVLFGLGVGATSQFGSSIIYFIMQFGILGFGVMLLFWIINGISKAKNNNNCFLLLIVFIISLYQRTFAISGLYGYVLLFGGMEWIIKEQKLLNK